MDTFGLGSPNCFVVNLSSLVCRLKRSFCQRANGVVALNVSHLDRICLGRSCMTFLYAFTAITYDESMEGRALPEAIENALRALFCEKNWFNMGVNERGLGRFPFCPKEGRAHLKHDFRLIGQWHSEADQKVCYSQYRKNESRQDNTVISVALKRTTCFGFLFTFTFVHLADISIQTELNS